jgi:hypothetical protein
MTDHERDREQAPDSEDREAVRDTTGMTDPDEGGSGTAGSTTREKDQAGSYERDAEQDPAGERHGRSDADRGGGAG